MCMADQGPAARATGTAGTGVAGVECLNADMNHAYFPGSEGRLKRIVGMSADMRRHGLLCDPAVPFGGKARRGASGNDMAERAGQTPVRAFGAARAAERVGK